MNLLEGPREWHAKWDGREGGRDGRVSHAIGKGNERALHVQLLHTDALRRRDGRGRAEGEIAIYMDGSDFRAEASGERARSVRE